ncbi:hypothetical protein L3Q82_000002 [Scortum barcoo]|uniref:Uncharacterized protein n=1 Tax=Scortum barcoo TaxID=214431 RepID=A0ACB8XB48_9TELE|nr:hypothetical protein L3Q82_000002 [Scortum barcoo]
MSRNIDQQQDACYHDLQSDLQLLLKARRSVCSPGLDLNPGLRNLNDASTENRVTEQQSVTQLVAWLLSRRQQGYNCSQALLPREVVAGKDNEPFAQRTDLGWSIVGCVNPCVDYGDAIGSSHRVVVRQVTPYQQSPANLTSEVRYVCRTHVKEVITPPDVIKALESDFTERGIEDVHFSQEDLRFLSIMEEGIRIKEDGHCEMPLPFKESRPNLPDNRKCADHRLKCLRRRFEKDKQYHKDYVAFMRNNL